MKTSAHFSRCRRYRFALWRVWDAAEPYVMIIGLNPSTADETVNDPTITRCVNFARSWGYGGVCVANLFAYKATYPRDLKAAADPVGRRNNAWLRKLARDAGVVVAAWGNDGAYQGRSRRVRGMLSGLHCLRMNRSGEPAHPLYLKADLRPVPMDDARISGDPQLTPR